MNVIKAINSSPAYESCQKVNNLIKEIKEKLNNITYDFDRTEREQLVDLRRMVSDLVNSKLEDTLIFPQVSFDVLTTAPIQHTTLEHSININPQQRIWSAGNPYDRSISLDSFYPETTSRSSTTTADFSYSNDETAISSRSVTPQQLNELNRIAATLETRATTTRNNN